LYELLLLAAVACSFAYGFARGFACGYVRGFACSFAFGVAGAATAACGVTDCNYSSGLPSLLASRVVFVIAMAPAAFAVAFGVACIVYNFWCRLQLVCL
jgi:hypothetical protein